MSLGYAYNINQTEENHNYDDDEDDICTSGEDKDMAVDIHGEEEGEGNKTLFRQFLLSSTIIKTDDF